ncbi:MAG TPA: hypothetical protein DHW14_01980, partial [Clostridiales bacterium]|nr:hypothetical protein [Clostridiales bacterium]
GDLESRAAHLRGLVRGLDLEAGDPGDRVLAEVVELLGDLVTEVAARRGRGTRPAAAPGAGREEQARAVFLACECPHCGGDVFAPAEPLEGRGRVRSVPGLGCTGRVVDLRAAGRPLFREFEVCCPHCGGLLRLRESSPGGRPPRPRH